MRRIGYHDGMTAEQYTRWTSGLRARPGALRALVAANRVLKYLCYLLYPLLLVLAAIDGAALFWRVLLVPALGFALETALRRVVNAPRPYEALQIEPLVAKSTRGRSFPSRHVFSIFMIAASWLLVSVPLGAALLALSCLMAASRVLFGVHFPRDVVAGAALALAFAAVGYLAVPW